MQLQRTLLCIAAVLSIFLGGCSRQPKDIAQGYIEGRYTYVATSVSGILKNIFVQRGTLVKQGQQLFILEAQPESDLLAAAENNLKQSVSARDAIAANLSFAKITYERYKTLVPKKAVSQSLLDNAQSNYFALEAQLAQANAAISSSTASVAQATWTSNQKVINSPVNGMVFDTYYRIGEYTIANQAILSLLAPADIKAIFYVAEPILSQLKLGEKVAVDCDHCEKTFAGTIRFIAPNAEYTPPVIFSNETNEKLIYRIEADFAPQDAVRLHPGQPVSVHLWQK